MYHSVAACGDDPARITVSPERFARQLRLLERLGIRGTSVRELLDGPGNDDAGPRVRLTPGMRHKLDPADPALRG